MHGPGSCAVCNNNKLLVRLAGAANALRRIGCNVCQKMHGCLQVSCAGAGLPVLLLRPPHKQANTGGGLKELQRKQACCHGMGMCMLMQQRVGDAAILVVRTGLYAMSSARNPCSRFRNRSKSVHACVRQLVQVKF